MIERRYFVEKDSSFPDYRYAAGVTYDGKDPDSSEYLSLISLHYFRWAAVRACKKHNEKVKLDAERVRGVEEVFVDD